MSVRVPGARNKSLNKRINNQAGGMEIDQLRELRKQKKISIVELAERMGVSQSYISQLERGKLQPTPEQIEVIEAFIAGRL